MTRRMFVTIAIAVLFAIQTLVSVSLIVGADPNCSISEERIGIKGKLTCELGGDHLVLNLALESIPDSSSNREAEQR